VEHQRAPRLRLIHVFAIGAGAMFSSGFFLLPGIAAAETGPSLPLAYLLAGLLVLPTMLSVTELAVAMPLAGGPYHFYRRALGPTIATVGGVGLWVALVLKAAFALVGIDAYLSIVFDLPSGAVGVVLAVVFTLLNVMGARESATIQVGLVAVLLVVLTAFVVVGGVSLTGTDREEFVDEFSPLFTGGAFGLLAATGIVFVAFAGLPQVASVAGEIRDPGTTIPRGILLALGVATAVYVAGTAVLILSLPAEELRGDETPIATAADTFGVWGAVPLIVIAALAAFASTANAGVMSASRYPLALARDGIVWARFARLNSAGTPVWAVVVSGMAIGLVVSVFDVDGIAKLASAFVLVSFGMMNASVIILRRARVPNYRPSFRVPGYPWVPALGILTSIVLVIDLGPVPVLSALGLAVGSAAWYRWVRRNQPGQPGALVWQHRRGRLHIDADMLAQLQEQGPIAEDRAPEALAEAMAERIEPSGGLDAVRRAASVTLASTQGVDEVEAHSWLETPGHPVIALDGGASEVHLINVDGPAETTIIVAWAPADDQHGGADDGRRFERRGATTAVVVGPTAFADRNARMTAMLANQLASDDLHERWPRDPNDVGAVLAKDAARRHGADPARR
jgi:basic amino acid/polyamine antiporter, APA family